MPRWLFWKIAKLQSLCLLLVVYKIDFLQANPEHIVDNFQEFSSSLLNYFSQHNEASETRPGVHLQNPFGVGYMLANVYQRTWEVSTKGIPSALRTLRKYIHEDYAYLLGLYKKSKFKITSTIYSRFGNLSKPATLDKLLTHLIVLDFAEKPAEFVDSFSSLLDISTKEHLDNEFLPKGLWQKVFDNETVGSYVNTLYWQIKHKQPWVDVGEKLFNYDTKIPFVETQGKFATFRNSNITAVLVGVQNIPKQEILFVKPHVDVNETTLRNFVHAALKNSSEWTVRKARIQVPALNITNLSRHNLGLKYMGINETFCFHNGSEADFPIPDIIQQPITQANYFQLTKDHIEFSSATGSTVSFNTGEAEIDLNEEYDEDDLSIILSEESERSLMDPVSRRHQKAINDTLAALNAAECELAGSVVNRSMTQSGGSEKEDLELIFNSPFLFSIMDATIGEVVSGYISSLCQYNKVLAAARRSPAHAWLSDVFKLAFWKCY